MSTNAATSDTRLLLEISKGSEPAFQLIFKRYCPRMLAFALKLLKSQFSAEEAVQEVFIRLWEHRDTLGQIKNPQDYLFILLRNKVMNELRAASRNQKRREQLWEAMEQRATQPMISIETKEVEQMLEHAVNNLSPQQQKIFRLSREKGLSHREIANELHISPLTAKKHVADSIKSIKSNLKKSD